MPLTKDEIRSLLSDIENERVERTLSTDNTKKIPEAICSFANDIRNTNKPGYFLIGADDNGNLDGLTRKEKLQSLKFSQAKILRCDTKALSGLENGTNGTDKTPGIIVNTTECGTDDDVLGTNSGTNIRENGTNRGTNEDVERKEAIIGMMKHNKRVSVTQISKALNIPRRTLFRIIDVLKSENRIKRVGELKSGTWEVIE